MAGMIVCSTYFMGEDPDSNGFVGGIDVYGHLPFDAKVAQHRLTLGKDAKTGDYIAWRHYSQWDLKQGITQNEIAFRSKSLEDAVAFCNAEHKRMWSDPEGESPFSPVPCNHNDHRACFCNYDWKADPEQLKVTQP